MSDYQKNHTPVELLARIIRLEKENERLKEHLGAHNRLIKELRSDLKAEAADTTKHIKLIHTNLVDIEETYAPVLYKVFPHLAVARLKTKKLLDELRLPTKK